MTSLTETLPERPPTTGGLCRDSLVVDPFLHLEEDRIYNPLTDKALLNVEAGFAELKGLIEGRLTIAELTAETLQQLNSDRWLVRDEPGLASRFLLKYVSLEAHTVCNQGCYFCPVSGGRRETHFMPMDFYEKIVEQLAAYRDTLEGVSMINYNEPTVDKRFVDQIRVLKNYGLPPAVLTNGTGLNPRRVDAIMELGGINFLSVNLSTLDKDRYAVEREGDHLEQVLKNLDYMKDLEVAPTMEIVVLGRGDDTQERDFEDIKRRFEHSRFAIKSYPVMDRAGAVPIGLKPPSPYTKLCGCEQTGSRPLQWVHINPRGECILCCQDYHEQYVIGDLNEESLDVILAGEEMQKLRRWVYGLETAPEDFLCRGCIYALTR